VVRTQSHPVFRPPFDPSPGPPPGFFMPHDAYTPLLEPSTLSGCAPHGEHHLPMHAHPSYHTAGQGRRPPLWHASAPTLAHPHSLAYSSYALPTASYYPTSHSFPSPAGARERSFLSCLRAPANIQHSPRFECSVLSNNHHHFAGHSSFLVSESLPPQCDTIRQCLQCLKDIDGSPRLDHQARHIMKGTHGVQVEIPEGGTKVRPHCAP
jgi:hypothetical protein